jgi:nucleotide-binding universal stress UspA family protein
VALLMSGFKPGAGEHQTCAFASDKLESCPITQLVDLEQTRFRLRVMLSHAGLLEQEWTGAIHFNDTQPEEALMAAFRWEWCKPSTILFATECPANERNFAIALAYAMEVGAKLILLHVSQHSAEARVHHAITNTHREVSPSPKQLLEPLADRARDLDIDCTVALREGSAAEEILKYIKEGHVDRVVIGVHTAGPVGKLLVGSVAETLLRTADVPVTIGSPYVIEGTYRNLLTRTILCWVDEHRSSEVTVHFAGELAEQFGARLILRRIIPPQKKARLTASQSLGQMETRILGMIPPRVLAKVSAHAKVTIGDPAEELLHQGRTLRANVIVMGAHDATHFAAVCNGGPVYKVLAYASCPVIALSPVVLAGYGPETARPSSSEINFLAGVI